jgi:butyryl-CoA dehydrogenase
MQQYKSFYQGKTVVISGAASGIGSALAHLFAEFGCKIALCDIDATGLEQVVSSIQASQQKNSSHPAPTLSIVRQVVDVANKQAWSVFLATCHDTHQHIDLVINNAGIEGSSQPIWASSDETLERVMDVNFYGMVFGSKISLPYLVQRPWAALVNVSSIFGLVAPPNTADYSASKFAIRGYTESLRAELALVHPQVQVHLVHPGGINTNITRLEHSQKFKQRFLTTEPRALALEIAKGVMHNKARIIFGNQAKRSALASRFLPLTWLSKVLSREIDGLGLEDDYITNHKGLTLPHKNDKTDD